MSADLQHAIIGTAGHIDHGKTALIKALTGVDVDTLAEEKRRGITIELGFAFLNMPGWDKEILFIDVPGHEKLTKTMVAGASNLDAALLVIAADEGISVQTIERFEILQLLGIERGVIALTKIDLVDEERLRVVTSDIRSLTEGTFLADAPIVPVSSITGEGIDDLKSALVNAANHMRKRADSGIFRMPIDRVFTMRGFGAVIAGTILSGEVKVGDKLEILPDGLIARVRGIQVHARSVPASGLGKRTAINLRDVKKEQLRRGQTACAPGAIRPTTRLDTRLQALNSYGQTLTNRTRVRFHVGADEVMARLTPLESDKIEPGQTALARFALESPTVALPKDRFVIRAFSSLNTIGGGVVVDSHALARKRFDESALDSLSKREGSLADAVAQTLIKSGPAPLSITAIASAIGENESEVASVIDDLRDSETAVRIYPITGGGPRDMQKELYLHRAPYGDLTAKFIAIIKGYYAKNPYRLFMPLSDLRSRFSKLAGRQVCDAVVADLCGQGMLVVEDTRISLSERRIQWRTGERALADRIEQIFDSGGYATLPEEEVMLDFHLRPNDFNNIITAMIEEKRLVRLGERVTYHTKHARAVKDLVIDHIKQHGGITAAELRDKLGFSRKYAVAILEYLDSIEVTKRLGDKRVLNK